MKLILLILIIVIGTGVPWTGDAVHVFNDESGNGSRPNDTWTQPDPSDQPDQPDQPEVNEELDVSGESDDILNLLSEFWQQGNRMSVANLSATVHVQHSVQVLRRFYELNQILIDFVLRNSFSDLANLMIELGVSTRCQMSMLRLSAGLRKQKAWALKLLDSYGRLSSGFIEGTLTDFGEFTECLGVTIPVHPDEQPSRGQPEDSTGKYCLLHLDFPMPSRRGYELHFNQPLIRLNRSDPMVQTVWDELTRHMNGLYSVKSLRLGICVPSTCRAHEVEAVLRRGVQPLLLMPVRVSPDSECSVRTDSVSLTTHQRAALVLYLFMLFVCAAATLVDLLLPSGPSAKRRGLLCRFILCFAVTRNLAKLFQVRSSPAPTHRVDLGCVHGLRVLSMFWIIVGHTYLFGAVYQVSFAVKKLIVDVPRYPGQMIYQPLTNTYLIVDSFFFFGGVVLVNVAIPMLRKHNGKFNYLWYLIHRALRMLPSLLGFTAFLFFYPLLSSGPIFKQHVNYHMQICERNWFYNIIFLSNYLWPSEMCAGQVWFTGADFQLYVFAPLVFLTLFWRETAGLVLCVLLVAFGCLVSALVSFYTETTATFSLDHLIDQNYLLYQSNVSYFPFYKHITTYVSGMLIGYLILRHKDQTLVAHKSASSVRRLWTMATCFGWIAAPVCSCVFMFCTFYWNNSDNFVHLSNFMRITMAATQQLGWVVGIGFITYQCATGRGGPVGRFLASAAFVPLSRLSFAIYLVHLVPIVLKAYSVHYTIPWSDFDFLSKSLLNTVICIAGALILHLLFEAPFLNLERQFVAGASDDGHAGPVRQHTDHGQGCASNMGRKTVGGKTVGGKTVGGKTVGGCSSTGMVELQAVANSGLRWQQRVHRPNSFAHTAGPQRV